MDSTCVNRVVQDQFGEHATMVRYDIGKNTVRAELEFGGNQYPVETLAKSRKGVEVSSFGAVSRQSEFPAEILHS